MSPPPSAPNTNLDATRKEHLVMNLINIYIMTCGLHHHMEA
jgi:hypothetical protein